MNGCCHWFCICLIRIPALPPKTTLQIPRCLLMYRFALIAICSFFVFSASANTDCFDAMCGALTANVEQPDPLLDSEFHLSSQRCGLTLRHEFDAQFLISSTDCSWDCQQIYTDCNLNCYQQGSTECLYACLATAFECLPSCYVDA